MSFFLSHQPAATSTELIKPAEQVTSESGIINRRFAGVAYWRGSIDFPPQVERNTLWAELERAAAAGGSFFADLHPQAAAPITPNWLSVVDAPTGFANNDTTFSVDVSASTTPFPEGGHVSFRRVIAGSSSQQAEGRLFVTARTTTARATSDSKYIYSLETPLPLEFSPEDGAVIEVCFNRPHVRAKLSPDALQWTTRPRVTSPSSVEWYEDAGGNLTFMHDILRSPTGGPNPPPLRRFLISEDGRSYITAEDGTYITSET